MERDCLVYDRGNFYFVFGLFGGILGKIAGKSQKAHNKFQINYNIRIFKIDLLKISILLCKSKLFQLRGNALGNEIVTE